MGSEVLVVAWMAIAAEAGSESGIIRTTWCTQKGGASSLQFVTHAQAAADEAARAANEVREPRPVAGNGYLLLRVNRQTIDLADPANQLVIVWDREGAEALRSEPPHELANAPEHPTWIGCQYSCWWSTIVVPLPEESDGPWTVRVADKTMGSHCDWTIDEKGRVR
jgi:hypothetical protein